MDFDIDKTYFSGFSVNNNGLLAAHTTYFKYTDIDNSLRLPVPNGQNYKPGTWEFTGDIEAALRYLGNTSGMSGTARTDFPVFVDLMCKIEEEGSIPANLDESVHQAINDYFEKSATGDNELMEAIKNIMINSAFNINKAVENAMSASRPVDMNKPQAGAQKSSKQWGSMQLTQDNAMFIPQMIEENNSGKI